MNAFDLKMGEVATVTGIDLSGGALERLSSLGITAGSKIEVISFSLLKSSMLISCNAARVGLRRSLAEKIRVSI